MQEQNKDNSPEAQEASQILESILKTTRDGYWRVDIVGNLIDVNQRYCDMSGYSRDELIGMHISDLEAAENAEEVEKHKAQIAKVGFDMFETKHRRKDGSEWAVEASVTFDNGYFCTFARDITERKKTETEREQYFNFFLTSSDIVVFADPNGAFLRINPATTRILGYSEAELISKPFVDFIHPDDKQDTLDEMQRQQKLGYSHNYVNRYVCKDGSYKWLSWNATYDKEINTTYAIARDVTEQKLYENALVENEETFKSILETASDAILIQDSTAAFIECNQAALDLLKMTREQFINMTPDQISVEFQPNGRRSEEYAPEMTALGRKGYHRFEWTCRDLEGGEFILEVTLVAFKRKGEDMLHCTWRNITERVLSEKKLKDSEELLNITGAIAHVGGWKIDLKEQRLSWSNEVYAIHETEDDFVPTVSEAIDFYDEESKPIIQVAVADAIEKGKPFDVELGIITRKGNHRDVRAIGSVGRDEKDNVTEVYGVFQDITEKKLLQEEHERFEQQTSQIQKLEALGVLAGGIAHDFNNLLAGIFGYIDLAKTATADESVAGYLSESLKSIERAKGLTQQLLTFSKGGAPLIRTADLGPIVQANAAFALSGSGISFDMDIDPSLWFVKIDENQIGQVISNLMINATQAMDSGGVIHITACNTEVGKNERPNLSEGKFVKLSISDTGGGIPPDLLKKIFDPFFTTKKLGQGLGLATSFSILKKHGGDIKAESVVGHGSTFHVFLPAAEHIKDRQDAQSTDISHKGTGKVLILDDESSIRGVLGLFLKKMGYSIVEACNGDEALKIGQEALGQGEPIDIAFFDVTIPGGKGGKETIDEFRKLYPEVPVYVISGYSDDPIMSDPAKYGFKDSIAKPFRLNDIAQLLERNANKF